LTAAATGREMAVKMVVSSLRDSGRTVGFSRHWCAACTVIRSYELLRACLNFLILKLTSVYLPFSSTEDELRFVKKLCNKNAPSPNSELNCYFAALAAAAVFLFPV